MKAAASKKADAIIAAINAASDAAAHGAYYEPLVKELKRLGVGYQARPARIEIVPDAGHWEARWMAPHVMLARGWERQLDRDRNGIFYDASQRLTPSAYEDWLHREAVS